MRSRARQDEGFGTRMRESMDAARLRPGELARVCGVHSVTVSRWRRGELPDDLRLPQLAQCLGVAVEWLKTGQGPRTVPAPTWLGTDHRASLLARLQFLYDQFKAYRDAGLSPEPEALATWMEVSAELLRRLRTNSGAGPHP